VGTASPATVLRVGRTASPFTLFETKDLSVQVVRLGPDGAPLRGNAASGKVYRLKPDAIAKQDDSGLDGKGATVVFDAAILDGAAAADGKATGKSAGGKAGADKSADKSQTNPKPNPKLNRTTSGR